MTPNAMNFSTKLFLSVILLACSVMVGVSTQSIRVYPNSRRYQSRVYHLSNTPVQRSLHHSRMASNHIPQSDAPASFHSRSTGSLPSRRSTSSFDINRIPVSSDHHYLPSINYGTTNYASQRDKKMAPSYFRNGNHHHITIPVPRNSVTRITVPLVNIHPASVVRHHSPSPHSIATWPSHSLTRNFQNHIAPIVQPHPYQSTVIQSPTKKHNFLIHVGTEQHPSIRHHHVAPPKIPYSTHHFTNNHYTPSRNELIVNSNNKAISTRQNVYLQNSHLSSRHSRPSTFMPPSQIHRPSIIAPTQHPKTYEDWRNSLGTSAFQSKPQKHRNFRQHLNVKLKNPGRSNYHQSKKNDFNNLPNMVTTSAITPAGKLNERRKTTVHIYLRHPQKHLVNSTVGTTKPPKSLIVPSNCIRCPSNQTLIIEKGKSCATVRIPPIKLCAWLSKRPGKLEMELGIGPKPGKSVKEGNYMMQFYLFKGGAKVQTCQFKINVKALWCPLIQSPENGAVQCTNNAIWGSTCNFSCKFGYTLVGEPATTCDGDKTAVSWTTPPPICEEMQIAAFNQPGCQIPDSPNNGGVYCESEGDKDIYPVGSICHFICNKGFTIPSHLTQYGYIICLGNGWNITQKVECHPTYCQPPNEPENGFASCIQAQPEGWTERGDTLSTNFLNGTKCQYKCDRDYIIPTSQLNITYMECHAPFWNNTALPECLKKTPPTYHPDDCRNITLTAKEGYTDTSLLMPRFFSANGLSLKPRCSLSGRLIDPGIYENHCEAIDSELRTLASCSFSIIIIVPSCSPLPEIQDGLINCTSDEPNLYAISSECYYDCHGGYVIPTSMRDFRGRICLPSAKWNVTHLPVCKKRLVPKPQGDACSDVEIQTSNPSSEILRKPDFLTADGKAAEVTCTFLNVSHEGTYENTCQATDPELQTTASCKYKVTVKGIEDSYTASSLKGHECGALKTPAHGKIRCLSEGSKFLCSIQCNEGFSLPSSFTKLNRNFVECDRNNGYWNFQNVHGPELPDCLAELPSTTLQRPIKFKVGVNNCSNYIALNNIMEAIQNSLQSRIKEICDKISCSDLSHVCGEDDGRNELMIETTLNLKVTYNATEYEDNEEATDAELNLNKLQDKIKKIVMNDTDFKKEIDIAGGTLWQDSFDFDKFILACPEAGYAIDPDTYKCFECPKGTIEEDGQCKPCPGNHYQDVPRRTYCMPCPHGTISKEGSRSKSDCQVLEHELTLPEASREQALTESTVFTSCDTHPCKNGGTCNIILNSFTCICKNGYTGKQCEAIICPENYCLNGGKCTSFANNVVGCACPKLFSGPRCETYRNSELCSSNPCENNGTCVLEDDSYKCHCLSNYMGEHCQHELCNKRFKRWYCLNGGTCSKVSDSLICLCQEEYTGSRCQHRNGKISLPQDR